MVHIVGEEKSPVALRHACDGFHQFVPLAPGAPQAEPESAPAAQQAAATLKRRPRFIVEAVRELGKTTPDGSVDLGALGNYLKKARPGFTYADYGHRTLRAMLESYELLHIPHTGPGTCRVSLAPAQGPTALQLVG